MIFRNRSKYQNKLVGGTENIYPLWVWRYGFSHYTTGRVWRLSGLWKALKPRFETELWLGSVRIAGEYSLSWRRPQPFNYLIKRQKSVGLFLGDAFKDNSLISENY